MDLTIKGTLEEVTAICYRIGEPNFKEKVEAQRKFGVVEYLVNHGEDLDEAIKTYDNDQKETEIEVAIANDMEDEVPEAKERMQEVYKQASKPEDEQLHLDGIPEPPKVNLKDNLHQAATELVKRGGTKTLTGILEQYGAKSVPELNESHYESALSKIKEALNG